MCPEENIPFLKSSTSMALSKTFQTTLLSRPLSMLSGVHAKSRGMFDAVQTLSLIQLFSLALA